MATVLAFSQSIMPEARLVNASYDAVVEPMKNQPNFSKDAVLTQDFEENVFPPTGWDTICGAQSQGNQHWHRTSGGRPDNGTHFAKIERNASTTNTTARPQDEWLISPVLTVPTNAVLRFWFHSNPYWTVGVPADGWPYDNADFNVKISIDGGGNWTNIWDEETFYSAMGWEFSEWTEVTLDLSTYVGQENVKIAFQYLGEGSCWLAIDNISVESLPTTLDYELASSTVTFTPEYPNYAFNGHYSIFPLSEIDTESSYNLFGGVVYNYSASKAAVKMVARVLSPEEDTVWEYVYPVDSIPAGSFESHGFYTAGLDTIYAYVPVDTNPDYVHIISQDAIFPMGYITELGAGTYTYEVTLEPAEGTYTNPNHRTISLKHNTEFTEECIYSRAKDEAENAFGLTSSTYVSMGTTFYMFNPEDVIQTIEAYIYAAQDGSTFHYDVYKNGETIDWVLSTESYTMEDSAHFTPGYISLSALDVYELTGQEELIVAVTVENNQAVYLGVNTSDASDTFYTFWANGAAGTEAEGWHFYTSMHEDFMIKLHTCLDGNAVETFTANEIEMFPNPTTGIVNFNNVENAKIEVYNMMGQVVANANSTSVNTTIDLSNLANGNYVVRIVKDGEVATSKLNIAR